MGESSPPERQESRSHQGDRNVPLRKNQEERPGGGTVSPPVPRTRGLTTPAPNALLFATREFGGWETAAPILFLPGVRRTGPVGKLLWGTQISAGVSQSSRIGTA